jgi:beta-lactamase class A
MWTSFKHETRHSTHSPIRWITFGPLIVIDSLLMMLLCSVVIPSLVMEHLFDMLTADKTIVTNGADQWNNNTKITAPVIRFVPASDNTLSVSTLFSQAYQLYGSSHNSLGKPITAAFPTIYGWLQFFTHGALLLPSHQELGQNPDDPLATLANNGGVDKASGVVRLPLIQILLTLGSQLPVGGIGSTLTYVDLRKATAPALMKFLPTGTDTATSTHSGRSNGPIPTSQGIFVQGGTRHGQAVGHFIPRLSWDYINLRDVSPHGWQQDFGSPLTEAMPFSLPINGQLHHMLIQVFSQEALLLDQTMLADKKNTTATLTSAIQLLKTGQDYLCMTGMPAIFLQPQQTVWTQNNTTILAKASTGRPLAHLGPYFPLALLGDALWINDVPWYHIQWSIGSNDNKAGWVSSTTLTFSSPGDRPAIASIDALSMGTAAYLNGLGINVGVVVYDITHQKMYTYNGNTPFTAASSIKVPIMLTFLDRIELQGLKPNDNELALMATMIMNSDNDSASALFSAIGGAAGISSYMQRISISGINPNDDAWGYSTITPQAMVDLLTLLYKDKILNAVDRALALNLMENVASDQQIGVGTTAPPDATVAMKDGWVTTEDDLWAMNSSGIVITSRQTYIVSLYTQAQNTLQAGQDIANHFCQSIASLLL